MSHKPVYDSGLVNYNPPQTVHAPAPAAAAGPDQLTGTIPAPEARGPMPVVVGCPRSGTTLLAVMLDSHPQIAMPPETAFLPALQALAGKAQDDLRKEFFALLTTDRWGVSNWNDLGIDRYRYWRLLRALETFSITAGLRVLYGMYADGLAKPLFGEKTPADTHCMPQIEAHLPEARFIHIVRDPRDVVLSLRRTTAGQSVERTAQIWVDMVSAARASAASVAHYHELRYEDLVLQPEAELRKVCGFLNLDYSSHMLEYRASSARHVGHLGDRLLPDGRAMVPHALRARLHETLVQPLRKDRVHGWRQQLTPSDRAKIEAITAPLMQEVGYDVTG